MSEEICECGHREDWHFVGRDGKMKCRFPHPKCPCKKFTPQTQQEEICENCGRDKLLHTEWDFDKVICKKFTPRKELNVNIKHVKKMIIKPQNHSQESYKKILKSVLNGMVTEGTQNHSPQGNGIRHGDEQGTEDKPSERYGDTDNPKGLSSTLPEGTQTHRGSNPRKPAETPDDFKLSDKRKSITIRKSESTIKGLVPKGKVITYHYPEEAVKEFIKRLKDADIIGRKMLLEVIDKLSGDLK